jgi:translation initiation factor 2-alpha kinase 4
MCLQIAIEKIMVALAAYQIALVRTLVNQGRSFGFWSPRSCDVYIVSFHPRYLQHCLEVLSWQHNISADMVYESSVPAAEDERRHML